MGLVRPATVADAEAVGAVHAQAWRETYSGLVPPALLARMADAAERAARWRRLLADPPPGSAAFLAESDGRVLGVADCGRVRDADLGAAGEVNATCVLRTAQVHGLGAALVRRMAGHLLAAGIGSAGAWVLSANTRARGFYEAMGAAARAERRECRPEGDLEEVAYVWGDLAPLTRGTR